MIKKPNLTPLDLNQQGNDENEMNVQEIEEEKENIIITPPTTPKKQIYDTPEYLSSKLSLYLLSHSIQTFDHQLLIEKIMKLVLNEDFLNIIYTKIKSGNDSLVYSSLSLIHSISSHKCKC